MITLITIMTAIKITMIMTTIVKTILIIMTLMVMVVDSLQKGKSLGRSQIPFHRQNLSFLSCHLSPTIIITSIVILLLLLIIIIIIIINIVIFILMVTWGDCQPKNLCFLDKVQTAINLPPIPRFGILHCRFFRN